MTISSNWYYDIVRYPVISEKATTMQEQGQCAFYVLPSATKAEIAYAVEKIFQVKVAKVRIVSVHGKRKVFRGRPGQCIYRKKAILTMQDKSKMPDVIAGV